MEDYKKKYEEALERARKINSGEGVAAPPDYTICETIFPELKESEDERIRKSLINYINAPGNVGDFTKKEFIAWLEKQGSQKPIRPIWKYKKDHTPLLRDSLILNKYGCVAKSPSGAIVSDVWVIDYDELAKLPKEEFERQDEKSHCGGEINDEALQKTFQIWFEKGKCSGRDEVIFHPENFGLKKQGEQKPSEYEKPLLEKFKQAVYDCAWGKVTCKKEGESPTEYANRWAEQLLSIVRDWADDYIDNRETAITRRAYEKCKADSLKEQNPAWSEEDEMMLNDIIRGLKLAEHIIFTCDCRGKTQIASRINWLKSLKERYTWKPSYEQMEALEDSIEFLGCTKKVRENLESLYEQLKKLREK